MGRMTPAELEQLKRDVSLLKVDESQGHSFKKHGKDGYTLPMPVPSGGNAFLRDLSLPRISITASAVGQRDRCWTSITRSCRRPAGAAMAGQPWRHASRVGEPPPAWGMPGRMASVVKPGCCHPPQARRVSGCGNG